MKSKLPSVHLKPICIHVCCKLGHKLCRHAVRGYNTALKLILLQEILT